MARATRARRALLASSLALLTMVLAGCATPPAERGAAATVATTATLLRSEFALSGRFSAKSERDAASGHFRYAQTATQRTLSVFSPLGTPLGDIVATPAGVTLTLANGQTQSAGSMAELLRTVIDVPLDDAALGAWLQGLPQPPAEAVAIERDGSGRPERFVQSGWQIAVSDRVEDGTGRGLPRRMRWSLAAQPEVEVRWVIDEWTVK